MSDDNIPRNCVEQDGSGSYRTSRGDQKNYISKGADEKTIEVKAMLPILLLGSIVGCAISEVFHRKWQYGFDDPALSNRNLNGDDYDEDHDEEAAKIHVSIVIVLVLILVTIGFEELKHHIESHTSKDMRPIIDALFGEMTVLGFVSTMAFIFAKTGLFDSMSIRVFGYEGADELEEIFENVHFALFCVMLFFVLMVLMLVNAAMQTEKEWMECDRICRDPSKVAALLEKNSEVRVLGLNDSIWKYLIPGMADKDTFDDKVMFYAIREEFLKARNVEPPFLPADASKSVGDDFNFGRYLSICLGHTLTHAVEIDSMTWLIFAFLTILFYLIQYAVHSDPVFLAWFWVGVGFAVSLVDAFLHRYLVGIRHCFAAPAYVSSPKFVTLKSAARSALNDDKKTSLVTQEVERTLPAWCAIDIEKYLTKRSKLSTLFNARIPNRQETLYKLENKGPMVHILLLRLNLIFTSFYCSVNFVVHFPSMYGLSSLPVFLAYVFSSILVALPLVMNKHTVSTISQVGCIGYLRKPQIIAETLRAEKTASVVRTFVVLCEMHHVAESSMKYNNKASNPKSDSHYSEMFDQQKITEVKKTFQMFTGAEEGDPTDKDGKRTIVLSEFTAMMVNLGIKDDPVIHNMFNILDKNGNGKVSQEDFLQWYASQVEEQALPLRERARFLFQMFDRDGSGEITIEEFKDTLDTLNVGFTVDEVADIVRELDLSDDGVLNKHEFEQLLKKYHPEELLLFSHEYSIYDLCCAGIDLDMQRKFGCEDHSPDHFSPLA